MYVYTFERKNIRMKWMGRLHLCACPIINFRMCHWILEFINRMDWIENEPNHLIQYHCYVFIGDIVKYEGIDFGGPIRWEWNEKQKKNIKNECRENLVSWMFLIWPTHKFIGKKLKKVSKRTEKGSDIGEVR